MPGAHRYPPAKLGVYLIVNHSRNKLIKKYLFRDVLIIADFALSALIPNQAEHFCEIVAEHHLKSSIIITSNRSPQDCIPLFPHPLMTNSALSRLVHHAHHLVMEAILYRKKLSPKLTQKPLPPQPSKGVN